jgi:hypothetical protein
MREEGVGGILEGGVKTSDEGRPVMPGDEGGMLFSCPGQFRAVYFDWTHWNRGGFLYSGIGTIRMVSD